MESLLLETGQPLNRLRRTSSQLATKMATTAFKLPGYQVTNSLGVVRGIVVRSRSVFGTVGASLQTVVGGNINLFADLCEASRRDAFSRMIEHASEVGASAIIEAASTRMT